MKNTELLRILLYDANASKAGDLEKGRRCKGDDKCRLCLCKIHQKSVVPSVRFCPGARAVNRNMNLQTIIFLSVNLPQLIKSNIPEQI